MAHDLAEALKSASVLKEALKSKPESQKHKSRSRSRSRGRSRAKSRCRSKSRARSRSSGRSKSRARGKSRARSRARSRSRSRSRSRRKSRARSKSKARRSSSSEASCSEVSKRKRNHSGSSNVSSSSCNPVASRLLEGLKMVMASKDMEERLPSLKDAIVNIKASDKGTKVQSLPQRSTLPQATAEDNLSTQDNDNMLLPHERVGSDFSWLQGYSEEDASVQKAKELEDEESFLYGNPLFPQSQQLEPAFSSSSNLLCHKQPLQTHLLASASSCLDGTDFEKVKNILKNLGALSDSSEPMGKVQRQKEQCAGRSSSDMVAGVALPALGNSNVRQALESLQSLIKATKDKQIKTDAPSQSSSDKHKTGDHEQRKTEKQDRVKRMDSMEKELWDLLKQEGLSFLTPVIGFYCQKCEEYIGDFKSVENHAAIHSRSNSSSLKPQKDKDGKDGGGNSQFHKHSERRDLKDYDHHKHSGDQRKSGDHENRGKCYSGDQAGMGSISLKEEMKKERMLITVSGRQTPPTAAVRASEERTAANHGAIKAEKPEYKEESREGNGKDKTHSSDSSSDNDEGKSPKHKRGKKKKKKGKKKKKDKKKSEKS